MKDIDEAIPVEELFDKQEAAEFPNRQKEFKKMYERGEAQIITQKSRFKATMKKCKGKKGAKFKSCVKKGLKK